MIKAENFYIWFCFKTLHTRLSYVRWFRRTFHQTGSDKVDEKKSDAALDEVHGGQQPLSHARKSTGLFSGTVRNQISLAPQALSKIWRGALRTEANAPMSGREAFQSRYAGSFFTVCIRGARSGGLTFYVIDLECGRDWASDVSTPGN